MRQTSPFILSAAVAALLSSSSLATGQDADFSSIPSPLYHQQRGLEIGDFARFNEIFANAELVIPDDAIDVGDGGLIKFSISNLFCRNINLGDMVTGYTIQPSPTTGQDVLAYTVNVSPFAMTCEADYTFSVEGALSFLSLDGVGHFIATTENNAVTTQIDISGPSTFALEPPTAVVVSSCQANIETNGNIEFQGATYERLLETFKGIISNVVDERAGKGTFKIVPFFRSTILVYVSLGILSHSFFFVTAACDALSDVGPTMLGSLLNKTDVRIDAWLAPVSPDLADPLFAENNFVAPDGVTLVHFQKNSTDASVSDTFVKFLKEADALFGETVIDETTGESDLGINVLLRKTLVNETTGSWEINIAEVEGFDPIVFNSSDKLTESNIRIDGMKITGLDTLQTFNPFVDIGGYTVSNNLTWEKLSLEVDMTVDIKPSTRPDRILRAADNNVNVVENIKVKVDLSSLAVDLSIFMAIDKTRFEGLDLGSLLSTENVLPCFLSSMIALEVSGLDVTITNMSVPELDGFVSPGIDRVLSNLAQAAFAAYEPTLLRAIPGIFQGPVRKLLKTRVLNTVLKYGENADCPLLPALVDEYGDSALMDFRDLFLRPEEASALGGSGEAPYGNIGHVAYKLIIDRLSEEDDDGLPQINEMLVRRITAAQSGEEGTMRFPQTLFEFGVNSSSTGVQARSLQENKTTLNLIDGLSFSLGDIRVSNLDTIVNPMELLNMTGNPYVLRNSAGLGTDTERNITLTIRVAAGFNDEMNEIDLVASIESLSFLADISALMDANAFLKFPLGEVLNYNCWLAALQAVELDEFGFAINSTSRRSLAIEDFSTSISSFGISSNCITCVSPGAQLLSELLQIQKNVGAISTLENRIPSFLRSFAMSDTSQTYFDRLVADASNLCPSSPTYSPEAVRTKYDAVGFPALSGESIDTLLFSGVIAAEVAFVMLAETQRSIDVTPSNPLSAQEAFIAPEGVRLLDWTDIGNSTGLSNIADEIFSQARTFLSGEGGNMFDFKTILEGLLGDDGVLEIDTDFKFERDNILLAVDLVRVKGLDSFTLFDVFVPIGPQTLSSSVEFDTLELEMVLSASIPKSTIPPQAITAKFAFQNVSADVALFAAFDLDKIGNLKIGSLLETRSLIKCILSAAHLFDIPQLKVSLGSFSNPTVDGLFPDTAPSAKLSIDTVFNRFRSEIEEAIPIIFDGVGKQMIARLLDSADEKSCGQPLFGSSQPGFVDFRDLLLPKQMSVLLGGSGMAQYGNLVSKVYTLLSDELFAPDEVTGLAAINRRLISKLGESQSGTPGRFLFSGDVISGGKQIQAGGLDADVSFRVYDAYINNLDTFGIPMTVLDPVQGDGQSLNNSISMGLNRSLQLGTRFFFGLSGDGKS